MATAREVDLFALEKGAKVASEDELIAIRFRCFECEFPTTEEMLSATMRGTADGTIRG